LTEFVPNAQYHGFPTYAQARNVYLAAKAADEIDIVRFPHDDVVFGPLDKAIQ
jgi:hypothetical protein